MMSVAITIQEVIDIASPLIIFALTGGLMPIVPVLAAHVLVIHVVVAISVFTVRCCVGGVDTVLFVDIRLAMFAIGSVVGIGLARIRVVVYSVISVGIVGFVGSIILIVVAVIPVVKVIVYTSIVGKVLVV